MDQLLAVFTITNLVVIDWHRLAGWRILLFRYQAHRTGRSATPDTAAPLPPAGCRAHGYDGLTGGEATTACVPLFAYHPLCFGHVVC